MKNGGFPINWQNPQRFVVITTCTDRKRAVPGNDLCAHTLSATSVKDLAKSWRERTASAQPSGRARDIYCGRSFTEARAAATLLSTELMILSAGLGLVRSNAEIPTYSLTLTRRSTDSICAKVTDANWRSSDWWSEISTGRYGPRSLGELVDEDPEVIILMALSKAYGELIADELKGLTLDQLAQFRLFGASLLKVLPERVAEAVMPFDGRLDGPESSKPGTMSDFASRALCVFAGLIKDGQATLQSAATDAAVVEGYLSGWSYPSRTERKRQSDEEILHLIDEHWDHVGGHATKMLPFLRRQLGVACEQSRFTRLFRRSADLRRLKEALV